jgi:hypothetical protein
MEGENGTEVKTSTSEVTKQSSGEASLAWIASPAGSQ